MGLSCASETGIDWFAIADMSAISQIHTGRVDRVCRSQEPVGLELRWACLNEPFHGAAGAMSLHPLGLRDSGGTTEDALISLTIIVVVA